MPAANAMLDRLRRTYASRPEPASRSRITVAAGRGSTGVNPPATNALARRRSPGLLREKFGLDQPFHVQLFHYMADIVRLNLGYSFRHNMPVLELILQRLGPTLLLMGTTLLLSVGFGVLLGIAAATCMLAASEHGPCGLCGASGV